MALESMGYTGHSVVGEVEILYKSNYEAEATTLDTTAFTDGVCKAGTPMTKTGTIATGADDVLGILLSDVYQERPQGSVVYFGTINEAVAKEHSGVTIDAAMKTAMKNVVFM